MPVRPLPITIGGIAGYEMPASTMEIEERILTHNSLPKIGDVPVFGLSLAQGFQHFVRCDGRSNPLSDGVGYGANGKQRRGHAVADT